MAKKRKKQHWRQDNLRLRKDHNWRAKPGYKIFVADRGAVRFDFPENWLMEMSESGSVKFHDVPPPDDDCLLEVSVMHLNPNVDWSGVPLAEFLADIVENDPRALMEQGEIVTVQRPGAQIVWTEGRFVDTTQEDRAARARLCLALGSNIQTIITMDLWENDLERFGPVWDEVLASLRIAEYVADPKLGPI